MPPRLPRKPFWRWEPFLLLMIVVFVSIGYVAAKFDLMIITPVIVVVAIAGIVFCGWRLVGLVVVERRGPTAGGRLQSVENFQLIHTENGARHVLEESTRRQSSIDIAIAAVGATPNAVLFPGATRWLGRELRTEVYLMAGNKLQPAGFLPVRTEARVGHQLAALFRQNTLVEVSASVRGAGKSVDPARPYAPLERPFTVEITLGDLPHREAGIPD
jgi:hypothetical protein